VSDSAAKHRANQTVRNLIYSLLVSLGLVLALVLGVPRDDSNRIVPVDYETIGQELAGSVEYQVLIPQVPEDWWSNAARLETNLNVQSWYIGFVTPDNQFIAMTQAFESNPSWVALTLQGNWPDGEIVIDGKTWQIWPTLKPSSPPGTKEFAMVHEYDSSAVVIYGTASREEFESMAKAITALLD
jgi:hypothetical protein